MLLLVIPIGIVVSVVGCGRQAVQLDPKWTPPVAVSSSEDGLSGCAWLHRCQDAIMGARSSGAFLLLNHDRKTWSQLPSLGGFGAYIWAYATADPQSMRILAARGDAENEQLVMKVLMGTITENEGLNDITKKEWITDKMASLGEASPNVKLNYLGIGLQDIGLGPGILNGSEAFIPFCLDAAEVIRQGKSMSIDTGKGPFSDGVFHSSDSGKTWQMEKISDIHFAAPDMCRTMGSVYYFAEQNLTHSLWFSQKSAGDGKWDELKAITKTLAWVYGRFAAAGEGDTAHICWMDRRHNKWRFNIDGPSIENDEIYYRRRKDTDQDWGKEILLSKGLLYAYAPTISAEGDNVVVTWAGIQTADKQHTHMGPNDIYYVTSKDGGKTWTQPLKATDGAKDGFTAGMPQVALLNGTIHLLYTQGKSEKPEELSPGLTKFSKQPWPIYYTQRPFPD
jgi:hypothetical protein